MERSKLNPVISGRGKPSPGVALLPDAAFAGGIFVNPDTVLSSLVDLSCTQVAKAEVATDPSNVMACLRDIRHQLDSLFQDRDIS